MSKFTQDFLDYILSILGGLFSLLIFVFSFLFAKYIKKIETHELKLTGLDPILFQRNQDEINVIKSQIQLILNEQEQNKKRDKELMSDFKQYLEKHDNMFSEFQKHHQITSQKINTLAGENKIIYEYVKNQIINKNEKKNN